MNSVGSKGDSDDNALAETIIGLYKTELIRRRGPWKGIDDVEFDTLEWVVAREWRRPAPIRNLRWLVHLVIQPIQSAGVRVAAHQPCDDLGPKRG